MFPFRLMKIFSIELSQTVFVNVCNPAMMEQRHFSLNPTKFLLIQEQLCPLYLLDI